MANKKCPKCGEDNPAEAVMCWACYTPLAGGAAAVAATATAAAGRPGAPGVGASEEKEKKQIDPKVFVLGGLAVVGILVALFTNGVFSGAPAEEGSTTTPDPAKPGGAPAPAPVPGAPPPPLMVSSSGGAPVPLVDVKIPYDILVPPNPTKQTGVVGIVPTQAAVTPAQAVGLASFARSQFARTGPWKKMQIYVFLSKDAGRAFADYQSRRRGEILYGGNHQELAASGIWSSSPACLMIEGNKAQPYYPSRNPNGWWPR